MSALYSGSATIAATIEAGREIENYSGFEARDASIFRKTGHWRCSIRGSMPKPEVASRFP